MAWAARRSDGSVAGVGFDRNHAPSSPGIAIVDINDNRAAQILNGSIKLQQCFDDSGSIPMMTHVQSMQKRRAPQRSYTTQYPAMMLDSDVVTMIDLAHRLPDNAIAVEIGSRLGGSATILLDNATRIKRLYCIDSEWADPISTTLHGDPAMQTMRDQWQLDQFDTCFQFATDLLSGYKNARLLAARSPYDFAWWSEPVDFVFEDSSHANPQLRDNLDFWIAHLKPGGIIAGHDYNNRVWPDVSIEADALSQRLGAEIHVSGTVWWMIKP